MNDNTSTNLTTNLAFAESELNEVVRLFPKDESLKINHKFTETEGKYSNLVLINGKAYAFCNLSHNPETELLKKRLIKRYAKLSVYRALSSFYGINLPWGALTGIRPTRLAYTEADENGNFEEFFTDVMKVSSEKTELTRAVLEAQKDYYDRDPDNTDFFVFVPFCPTRCKYCSFITQDLRSSASLMDEYTETLVKEIEQSAAFVKKLRSIYVGGGTPVALSDENLIKILSALDKINTGVEFTVEAGRPDRITKENLKILKDFGVTRVCVNPQTFSDETLKRIGREHTAAEAVEKYLLAKDDFVTNMDFIAGLEGETAEVFAASIEKAIELSPDDITVHTLCVKRGSYLAEETDRIECGEIEKMVNFAEKSLSAAGYRPYYLYRQKYMAGNLENAGYAKKGKECVYNIDTMEEISSTVACGAGAISKRVDFSGGRIERFAAPKDVKTYLSGFEERLAAKRAFFKEPR